MLEKTVPAKEGGDSLQGHLIYLTQAPQELISFDKQPHPSPIQLKCPHLHLESQVSLSMALRGSMAIAIFVNERRPFPLTHHSFTHSLINSY